MAWIKVTTSLPQEGQPFLYFTKNRKVMVCQNRPLDDWFINKYSVTHWQPLPEPPDE